MKHSNKKKKPLKAKATKIKYFGSENRVNKFVNSIKKQSKVQTLGTKS